MIKIAVLQLSYVGMSSSKLDYFLRIAHAKHVSVVVLGEYILNPFFKELINLPVSMIKEQSDKHLAQLKNFAQEYDLHIIAPIVLVKSGKPYKSIAKISPSQTKHYFQQMLIPYKHWNEANYFANTSEDLETPMIFNVAKFKFALMSGYELHFDSMWRDLMQRGVDAVLLPTSSTFDSSERWREIIKMRAFTNNIYVLRANRIGEYADKEIGWSFYGDSLFVKPDGKVDAKLGNKEELMIVKLYKEELKDARKTWGFKEQLQKKNVL